MPIVTIILHIFAFRKIYNNKNVNRWKIYENCV